MPHAAWPLKPVAKAGPPTNEAPASSHAGVAQVREVPRRRDRRAEVRVVGEDRGTRCGPRSGDGPGVRAAGCTHQVAQAREVIGEPGERLAGAATRRRDDRLPRGVGRLDRRERLGAIGVEDREARQLGVPVAGEREGLEPIERQHVLDVPCARLGPEQHELVRARRARARGVDAGDVRGDRGEDVGVERLHLGERQAVEPERPRQPVDRQRARPEQLGQPAAARTRDQLELEGTILSVAEAEREPGVGVAVGLDVRDPPPVTVDDDLVLEPRHAQRPARPGQPPAEGAEQRSSAGPGGHPRHDATVYSAS